MSKNDIWYGFMEAGAKSSPVVRDMTLEATGRDKIYLYNFARGMFLEYAAAIVEPKLRDLKPGEVSLDELESAFQSARKAFNPGKPVRKWSDSAPVAAATASVDNDTEDDAAPDLDSWEDFSDEDD